MIVWLRRRRLAKLQMRAEVLRAKWNHEVWLAEKTGKCYPVAMSLIIDEQAELDVRIRALQAALGGEK